MNQTVMVLQAFDQDEVRVFFERLGLKFTQEQHDLGDGIMGQKHFTSVSPDGRTVFEIYPGTSRSYKFLAVNAPGDA